MKTMMLTVFACLIAGTAMAADLTQEEQKTLYFLGQAVSSKLKQFEFTPEETKQIVKGFSETLGGEKEELDPSYGVKLNAYLAKKQEAIVDKQKEASKPFLAKMAKEKGARKLESGMVYIPVKEGKGKSPKASDMVKVHYHGTFPDGKVFDSSVDRGTPAEFPLSGVIPCWTEGVQKMKVGGKARLVCPSDTAYGDHGAGGTIPGGATLVFEVELLDILKENPMSMLGAPKAEKKADKKAEKKSGKKEARKTDKK